MSSPFFLGRFLKNIVLFSGFGCLVLAWLDPNHYLPWTTFRNELLAWGALILVAISAILAKLPLRLPSAAACVLVISVYPVLQFATGNIYFFGDMLLASIYLFGFGFAIAIGYILSEKEKIFSEMLATAVLLGALVSFFIALCQWLSIDLIGIWAFGLPRGDRPYGNLAQPNNLASLLLAGVVAALYLRFSAKWGNLLSDLIVVLLMSGVAMTQSRTALVAFVLLLIGLVFARRRLILDISKFEIGCGGALGLLFWFAWPTLSGFLYLNSQGALDRLVSTGSDVRTVMWAQLLDAAWQRPITGWGWNQVSVAQVEVAGNYPHSVFTEHSHNIFVDLMVWNGAIVGGFLGLLIFAWVVIRLSQISTIAGWYAMASIMVFGTHAMLEFPLDYAFFLVPMGFFIGIVEANIGARVIWIISTKIYAVLQLLGCGLIALVLIEYLKVEDDHRRLRFESIGIERRSEEHIAPDVTLLTQAREFLRFARTEARQDMSAVELEWMRQVAFRYAYPPAMFRYALALGLNGRYEEAETQLLRLRQLHPPIRYREAQEGWGAMSERFAELGNVRVPDFVPVQDIRAAR